MRHLIVGLVAIAGEIVGAGSAQAWVVRERPSDGSASPLAMAMGTDGNPVAVGYQTEPAPSTRMDFLDAFAPASAPPFRPGAWSRAAPNG